MSGEAAAAAEAERDEDAILSAIGVLIHELVTLRHAPSVPFVTGWAVSVHSEAVDWERDEKSQSDYFWPDGQTYPTTTGLFTLAATRQMERD